MEKTKFKVWDKKRNKWVDNIEVYDDGSFNVGYFIEGGGLISADDIELDGIIFDKKKDAILLQFTGLKDKNGKELYKHFIFKRSDGQIGVIRNFIEDTYHLIQWLRDGGSFEIIGSIYENLELSETK